MRYQAIQDDRLMVEAYEQLLLETPVTKSNIKRFIEKYYAYIITAQFNIRKKLYESQMSKFKARPETPAPAPFEETKIREEIYASLLPETQRYLETWTSRLQQIVQANGGNPDIFSYENLDALNATITNVQISKTEAKKAYKKVEGINIIQETPELLICQPESWEASRKYFGPKRISLLDGTVKNGTRWCTASSEPKHFKEYVTEDKDRLIYIVRKQDDVLFAVRSRPPTDAKSNANVFKQFQEEYLQWVEDTVGGNFREYNQSLADALHDVEMDLLRDKDYGDVLIEVRTQENLEMWFSELVLALFQGMKNIKDVKNKIIPFVGLVVFGITSNK